MYRRERWLSPSGKTVMAALPQGAASHFGPGLKRFILSQYQQGQVTIPRLVTQLRELGIDISKRQIVRLLSGKQDAFLAEAGEVMRAGLASASWITVDDTGARHKAKNGFCIHIGNERFAWFATRSSKAAHVHESAQRFHESAQPWSCPAGAALEVAAHTAPRGGVRGRRLTLVAF